MGRPHVNQRKALDRHHLPHAQPLPWNHLPKEFGDDRSVHRTLQRRIALGVLDQMLANIDRLKVRAIMGSRGLIDKEKEELIGIVDFKLADEWIDKLIAAGVDAK